jgi:bifunctional UDP-N-acetylglucosamine pyrophosphorylase/glucosamine-1-phosphate N-acetyltransferase
MTTVIILAGGEGKRMGLTQGPKVIRCVPSAKGPSASHETSTGRLDPTVPSGTQETLNNSVPMIVSILSEVGRINYKRIIIVVGKHKELIDTVIQEHVAPDMLSKITYVMQPVPKGTGHAVMCCLHYLQMNDNVLILSGDVPYIKAETMELIMGVSKETVGSKNLKDLKGAFNKIRLMTMRLDNPTGYGRVIEDADGNVRIVEQRDCTDRELEEKRVNCGIYYTTGRLLMIRLPFLSCDNAQSEYYLTDIVNKDADVELCEIDESRKYEVTGINTELELEELVKSVNAQCDDDTPF